ILRTKGFVASSWPIPLLSLEVMTENTPLGIPAISAILAKAMAVKGVCEAGFSTIVHPATRAGAIFREIIARGKFHGVMAPTTPTLCFIVDRRVRPLSEGMFSP